MSNIKITPHADWMHSYLDFQSNENFLTQDFLIYTRSFNKHVGIQPHIWCCFIVTAWTSTDGASIPFFWTLLVWMSWRSKKIFLPAVGHDLLYVNQRVDIYYYDKVNREIWEKMFTLHVTQDIADDFIRDKMEDMWANVIQRLLVRLWLRIGGHRTYNTYTKK